MKSAAIAAIALLGALILAGVFFLGEKQSTDAPATIGRTAEGERDSPLAGAEADLMSPESDGGLDPVEPTDRVGATEATIARSGQLELKVVDAMTGEGVPKYWVKPSEVRDMASPSAPLLADPASGRATLPATLWNADAPLSPADFLVSAPLFEPHTVSLEGPGAASRTRTIELPRASAIVGVVRDGASAPVPAARVTLEFLGSVPGLRPETSETMPLPDAYQGPTLRRTDGSGRYSFGRLPPGAYRTRVERDGTVHVSDPISVQAGRWSFGDHWLDEHVRLTVTVLDPAGVAAKDSRVLLVPASPDSDVSGSLNDLLSEESGKLVTRYTDAEGRATLGPLSEGHYHVSIQSDAGEAFAQMFQVEEASRSIVDLEFRLTESKSDR